MDAEPDLYPDRSRGLKSIGENEPSAAVPPLGPPRGDIGTAPPHLLWETLESAFSGTEIDAPQRYGAPVAGQKRLAGYMAIPIALGLSLALWIVIVMLAFYR